MGLYIIYTWVYAEDAVFTLVSQYAHTEYNRRFRSNSKSKYIKSELDASQYLVSLPWFKINIQEYVWTRLPKTLSVNRWLEFVVYLCHTQASLVTEMMTPITFTRKHSTLNDNMPDGFEKPATEFTNCVCCKCFIASFTDIKWFLIVIIMSLE